MTSLGEGSQEDAALGIVNGQLHAVCSLQFLGEDHALDEVFARLRGRAFAFLLEDAGAVGVAIKEKFLEWHGVIN